MKLIAFAAISESANIDVFFNRYRDLVFIIRHAPLSDPAQVFSQIIHSAFLFPADDRVRPLVIRHRSIHLLQLGEICYPSGAQPKAIQEVAQLLPVVRPYLRHKVLVVSYREHCPMERVRDNKVCAFYIGEQLKGGCRNLLVNPSETSLFPFLLQKSFISVCSFSE